MRQQRGACVCNRSGSGVSRYFGYVNRRRLTSCDYRDRNGPEWRPFAVVGAGVLLWDKVDVDWSNGQNGADGANGGSSVCVSSSVLLASLTTKTQ